MSDQTEETAKFIRSVTNFFEPQTGIILGTGLGGLVKEIQIKFTLPYAEIPNFPVSTVEGHSGSLILGFLSNNPVIVMQGRFHFYEGYSMEQIAFPVRMMQKLGIKRLFISNASGGMNPEFNVGDLMVISDHINLFPSNPLLGRNNPQWGPRFPEMSEAYDKNLISRAFETAQRLDFPIKKGVYIGLSGPCFETPAEYKFLRIIGGDAVGMSTIPEVIAARHMGIPVFAMSVITDLGVEGKIERITHEDVIHAASMAESRMTQIFKTMLINIEE